MILYIGPYRVEFQIPHIGLYYAALSGRRFDFMRLAAQGVAHGFAYTATSWRSADLFTTAGWNIGLYYVALSGRWFDFMRLAAQGVAHGFTYIATPWR